MASNGELARHHGVSYVRLVVKRPANAGFVPGRGTVLELPLRQDKIDFFLRMIVVRVTHMRGHQGDTDANRLAPLQAAGADDHGVGMAFRPIGARERPACGARRPT